MLPHPEADQYSSVRRGSEDTTSHYYRQGGEPSLMILDFFRRSIRISCNACISSFPLRHISSPAKFEGGSFSQGDFATDTALEGRPEAQNYENNFTPDGTYFYPCSS